jgi:hypothetical protein
MRWTFWLHPRARLQARWIFGLDSYILGTANPKMKDPGRPGFFGECVFGQAGCTGFLALTFTFSSTKSSRERKRTSLWHIVLYSPKQIIPPFKIGINLP